MSATDDITNQTKVDNEVSPITAEQDTTTTTTTTNESANSNTEPTLKIKKKKVRKIGSREVYCQEAVEWLKGQEILQGSVITSLPDVCEVNYDK